MASDIFFSFQLPQPPLDIVGHIPNSDNWVSHYTLTTVPCFPHLWWEIKMQWSVQKGPILPKNSLREAQVFPKVSDLRPHKSAICVLLCEISVPWIEQFELHPIIQTWLYIITIIRGIEQYFPHQRLLSKKAAHCFHHHRFEIEMQCSAQKWPIRQKRDGEGANFPDSKRFTAWRRHRSHSALCCMRGDSDLEWTGIKGIGSD